MLLLGSSLLVLSQCRVVKPDGMVPDFKPSRSLHCLQSKAQTPKHSQEADALGLPYLPLLPPVPATLPALSSFWTFTLEVFAAWNTVLRERPNAMLSLS